MPMASPVSGDASAAVNDLAIGVVDVQGHCLVYHRGDRFYIRDGFRLVADRFLEEKRFAR